jgi:hypothetical protein
MSLSIFVILFFSAIFTIAVPVPEFEFGSGHPELDERCKTCSTSKAKLVLPEGQTNLTATMSAPSFVMLGVGFQNYTCSAAGTYTSVGATADLFDLSCLSEVDSTAFDGCPNCNYNNIQDFAFAMWSATPVDDLAVISQRVPTKLGAHFFIKNANGGISPSWDFRGNFAPNQPDAFVVAAKVAGLKAPTGQDVDWLQLKGVSGGLATSLYRTHTRGGQPPTSCSPGSADIRVKYVSEYWLYGSTVTLS